MPMLRQYNIQLGYCLGPTGQDWSHINTTPHCSQGHGELSHPNTLAKSLPTFPPLQGLSSRDTASHPLSYDNGLLTAEIMRSADRPASGELGDMQTQFVDVVTALALCSGKFNVLEISVSDQVNSQQLMTSNLVAYGANVCTGATSVRVPMFNNGSAWEFPGRYTSMPDCQPYLTATPISPWLPTLESRRDSEPFHL